MDRCPICDSPMDYTDDVCPECAREIDETLGEFDGEEEDA